MTTIMIPLDGSLLAEEALGIAVNLAKTTGAGIELVSVEPPLSVAAMLDDAADGGVLTPDMLRTRLRGYLASKAEALRTTHGLPVSTRLLRGIPATALAARVRTGNIDLVVMTTHGRGGLNRFWLGSVADQLLRRVTAPVLLIRPGFAAAATGFHRVLVALDGTARSEAAIRPGALLAGTTPGSSMVLAHVVEPLPFVGPEYEAQARRNAAARLEHLAYEVSRGGTQTAVRIEGASKIAARILEMAEEIEADLVVVGTHGARGIERLLLGSVADKVVRGAKQPVLVVPCWTAQDGRSAAVSDGGALASI